MAKKDPVASNGHVPDLDLTAYMPEVRRIKVGERIYSAVADIAPSLTVRIQKWFEQLQVVQDGGETPDTFDDDLFAIAASLLGIPHKEARSLGYDGAFAVVNYFLGEVNRRRLATTSSEAPSPSP